MRRLLVLVILVICCITPSAAYVPDTLTVTFLDVGEADAAIVQAPNGHAMLVDAGASWAAPAVSSGLTAEAIARPGSVDVPAHAAENECYPARG